MPDIPESMNRVVDFDDSEDESLRVVNLVPVSEDDDQESW